MSNKVPISVIILTYNEEENIEKCLKSIYGWVNEVLIVDSYSTDKTLELAKKYIDKIYQHKFDGHTQQWQWALNNLPIKSDWIFALDADFIVTEELWKEVSRRFDNVNKEVVGFYVRRKEIFKGRAILHGGVYPNYRLIIFKKNQVRFDENELVDAHFYVGGKVEKLEFDVIEQNSKDNSIFFWIEKQNKYARRQAIEEIRRKNDKLDHPIKMSIFGTPDQRKLFLKNVWYRFPLYIRPFIYFFYRYILKLGILDGKEGFIYHFTQCFLYRMLVDINIDEILSYKKKS
ncbi:hypothetical protein ES703_10251 [subsurface metagenome]